MVSVNDLVKYLCMFSAAFDYVLKFLKRRVVTLNGISLGLLIHVATLFF